MEKSKAVIILVIIFGCILIIQFTLSNKKNKWLGIILPLLNFIYALYGIIPSFYNINEIIPRKIIKKDEFGIIMSSATIGNDGLISFIISSLTIFLAYNITTIILIIIYIWRKRLLKQQKYIN